MKYIVRKEMPRAIVGDIVTASLDDDLILRSGLRVLDNLMIEDAIAGGFIEPYEEKPKHNKTKQSLQSILKAHELLMIERNGRPDCKNCVLAESIQEFLDNEVQS